jgi:hypothetical protein
VQATCNISLEKDLDKGYNFSLDLIAIKGLHTKLCALKVAGVPVVANGSPPNSLRDSNVSPKLKTSEEQRVRARSLARSIIEG